MGKNGKTDIRVIKTKAAVRRSFLALASIKPVAEITIKDISDQARINRTTFYLHYRTIEDMYNDIINENLDFCKSIIEKHKDELSEFDFAECAVEFAEHHDGVFGNNKYLKGSLFALSMKRTVCDIFCNAMTELYSDPAMKEKYIPLSDAVLASIVAGMVSVISSWISSDRSVSLKDSCRELSDAIINGIKKK